MNDELISSLRICGRINSANDNCIAFHDGSCEAEPVCMYELMGKAADAIEELQEDNAALNGTVSNLIEQIAELSKPRWIPVTERLPNCNGCYLVWRPHFFGGKIGMPSICYFDGSNTWHDSYGVDFERTLHPEDITHWMPLPEPPKEE